ncbi:2Fe-2S iron-sulfur cluster-binding protein [Mycolicibacterium sp. 120266]|uniref:2Fe-2S iron-sulfur cluster-binding protein n=1 Tax=Mycolicibacterium sp. 120266 TaxID=3090601 RepID=UPI00299E9092|nr:2Fe-2S iron-sulfur cluster-binding protein [Mycolicibacterium sp. 120266]MDX1876178.1 2Fe-2S iron-sulfur cluster-binding protein [Mycolicibacterium sp. 120266]
MPTITFVSHLGVKVDVDALADESVMQAATRGDVDGIVGECGGNAMCATCHVYVSSGPVESLPPIAADEDEMLDSAAAERRDNSRLSCQLIVSNAFEGLTFHVPETQI